MKVFITGGSGWIGSEVVLQLIAKGHSVVGLARSDASADKIISLGASAIRGDLEDLDIIKSAASSSDAVIHCGFIHDFSDPLRAVTVDKNAVEAIASALEGTSKPFVYSSGALGLITVPSRLSKESDEPDWEFLSNMGPLAIRVKTDQFVLSLKDKGIRSVVIRLPPAVHGKGDMQGFITTLIEISKKNGVAGYIGEGENVWPAVHRSDAAKLYVLALEKAEPGTALHAIAEEGLKMKDIVAAVGKGLGVEVKSNVAAETLTWMAMVFQADAPTSSAITKKIMGWKPVQKGLLTGITESYL